MWTPTTRQQHSHDHLRYGSDLTDAEWGDPRPVHAAADADGAGAGVANPRDH